MRTATRPSAGTASFAHLVAPTRAAASRAEENDDERDKREEEERAANKKATGRAETDDEREEREDEERAKNKASTGKAETDDEREEREARAAEDDDESGEGDGDEEKDREEMAKASRAGHARALAAAERKAMRKVRAVLRHHHAARNLPLAVQLATQRGVSALQAIAILGETPVAAHATRADRNPNVTSSGGASGKGGEEIQQMWDAAFARAVPSLRNARR